MLEEAIDGKIFPVIPDKRYFTIGEVSTLCNVKPHILRYWEQEFPMLEPVKRRGNRRYYQRRDVLLIREIRILLYEHGYTIQGARQKISGRDTKGHSSTVNPVIQDTITELEQIMKLLR